MSCHWIGSRDLCGFLSCERRGYRAAGAARDDLHLLPIVGKLFAAIEAHDISPGGERSWAATSFFHRYRKAVMSVPATKQRTQQPGDHLSTSQNRLPEAAYMN